MPQLEIKLLGSFDVTLGGQSLQKFRSDKVRGLLAYLVIEHNRPLRRAHLVDLLWNGYTQATALNSLAKSLTNLHHLLGETACLQITRHTVELDVAEGVWCDALTLADTLKGCQQHSHPDLTRCIRCRNQLQQAAILYRGEFLRGLSTHDEQPFDIWREKMQAHFQGVNDAIQRILQTPQAPPRHNLPRTFNRFFGREQETAALSAILRRGDTPLLTLIGEGGVGKTRLALTVADQVKHEYADGVWFVPLAALPSALADAGGHDDQRLVQVHDRIAVAVAKSLGLTLIGAHPPHLQIMRQLQQRHLLLILDNFEHLLPGARWLSLLAAQAQFVYLLVTSRQRLGLQAEHVLRVVGLPVPPRRSSGRQAQAEADAADASQASSVRLFIARAERIGVALPANAETRRAIVSICQTLEGLPLGIELAATLLEQQPLAAVESQLLNDFASLTTTEADVSPHHRSLAAVFEQSWRGLSAVEAQLLARCSVFRGGFTEAAAAIVADAAPDQLITLEHRSLLRRSDDGRFDMHNLMRQFAAARLGQSGEAPDIASRHSQHYLAQLTPADYPRDDRIPTCSQTLSNTALVTLIAEIDNVRQAWLQAVMERRFAELGWAADGLARLLEKIGLLREGQQTLARTGEELHAAGAPAGVLNSLYVQQAMLFDRHARYADTLASAQRALTFATTELQQAQAWMWCGAAQWKLGDPDAAEVALQQGLQNYRRHEHLEGEATCLHELGSVAYRQGNLALARERWENALAFYLQVGCKRSAAGTLSNLSASYTDSGAFEQAREYIRAGLRLLAEAGGHPAIQGYLMANDTRVAILVGDYENARVLCTQALEYSRDIQHRELEAGMLAEQAWLSYYAGADMQACQSAEAAIALCQEMGSIYAAGMALPVLGHARRRLGDLNGAGEAYREAVRLWEQHTAPELALDSLAGLALIAWQEGQAESAWRQVAAIVAMLDHVSWEQEMIAEPAAICLACYDVLSALGDCRAGAVLQQAQRFVRARADRINDPILRGRFLDDIAAHRQIMALSR